MAAIRTNTIVFKPLTRPPTMGGEPLGGEVALGEVVGVHPVSLICAGETIAYDPALPLGDFGSLKVLLDVNGATDAGKLAVVKP
jgi:hypothetical protein